MRQKTRTDPSFVATQLGGGVQSLASMPSVYRSAAFTDRLGHDVKSAGTQICGKHSRLVEYFLYEMLTLFRVCEFRRRVLPLRAGNEVLRWVNEAVE